MKLCEEKEKIEVEIKVIQSSSGIKGETYFTTKYWKAWIRYSDEFTILQFLVLSDLKIQSVQQ